MRNELLTVFPLEAAEGGKGGKGGGIALSNAELINSVFRSIPEGAFAAISSKAGNPRLGGWAPKRADQVARLSSAHNNYVNCASFFPGAGGSLKARTSRFAAYHFLMLDDLGTKVPLERLTGFKLSWLIETSPGNYQGGIILADPVTDEALAKRLLNAAIDAGLCDAGAAGLNRWARLPVGINGKTKYADEAGMPFNCRLVEWRPEQRYTPQEIVEGLELELAPPGRPKKDSQTSAYSGKTERESDEILTPRAAENPVVSALKARGLYKTELGAGKHDITCPWVHEHTDAEDGGAAYFEPDELYPTGGFCCLHSHRSEFHIRDLLEFLNVENAEARHKPVIRVMVGDLDRVVDAAEKELATRGRHYQAGGLIVSVSTDPTSGNPSILPVTLQALTKELSIAASWQKYDGRAKGWVRCDPPPRHVNILYDVQQFRHLLPLAGVARQPYFRESDGELVMHSGYDAGSRLFGVFDPRQFVIGLPTIEAARLALTRLEDLLEEFRFVGPSDKAAALSAIFTAVTRPTLSHAPAFHVRAPVFGSGKSYLCELIGLFAGPGANAKVSYPTTSEEATKSMLSLLLANPAVIEFDDMDGDWIPHGVIKRMLTAEYITDRVLGVSKTATVSTRTLFLSSGNNVGPVRDLLRRVLTIHIDPRCATPATVTYRNSPVDRVRRHRGAFVADVLTILTAWRAAGSPRAEVDSVATFNGLWTDLCRHPLIWLGHPDPALSLLEQIKHDPDSEALAGFLLEWWRAFGETPMTVRKVLEITSCTDQELYATMLELPVTTKGQVDPSKFGWFMKKNVDRIVGGLKIQKTEADGRNAWRVVSVDTPPLPPLPPFRGPIRKTSAGCDLLDLIK